MNAHDIFRDVLYEVPKLLDTGEIEIFFGEDLLHYFKAYTLEDAIEVEYNGKSLKIECKNFSNEEYVARLIMHCFARLYLNR